MTEFEAKQLFIKQNMIHKSMEDICIKIIEEHEAACHLNNHSLCNALDELKYPEEYATWCMLSLQYNKIVDQLTEHILNDPSTTEHEKSKIQEIKDLQAKMIKGNDGIQ